MTRQNALNEAAEWFAVLAGDAVSDADRLAWQRWLEAAPDNRHAWDKIEKVRKRFGGLDQPVRAALLGGGKRRGLLKSLLLIAGGGGLLAGIVGRRDTHAYLAGLAVDYRTSVGEIRDLALPDDSRAWLNTASALDVRYDAGLRRIVLVRGEVLVQTAPDRLAPARPLVVDADGVRLRALGTRFSVHLADDGLRVTVLEGRVQAESDGAVLQLIQAGQQWRRAGLEAGQLAAANPDGASWARRRLVVTQQPLQHVIDELGRYRSGALVCHPGVAQLKVVGSYPLDDTDQALRMLANTLPVRIEQSVPWRTDVLPR